VADILIDVVNARTNHLVCRGFSKNDVIQGAANSTRAARIAAVAQVSAGFFPPGKTGS